MSAHLPTSSVGRSLGALLAGLSAIGVIGLGLGRAIPLALPAWSLPVPLSWTIFALRTFEPALGCVLIATSAAGAVLAKGQLRRVAAAVVVISTTAIAFWGAEGGPGPGPALSGPSIRVQVANLRYPNVQASGVLSTLREVGPELLILPEWTPFLADVLRPELAQLGLEGAGWPLAGEANGIALFAGHTLTATRPEVFALDSSGPGYPQARARLRLGKAPVEVLGLHLLGAHFLGGLPLRGPQFAEVLARIDQVEGPLIVAGDFNFTARSAEAAAFRARGLRGALALCGDGRQPTWPVAGPGSPNEERPWFMTQLPILFRIDGVYLSRQLTCHRARTVRLPGSDHLSVVVEVGLDDTASAN